MTLTPLDIYKLLPKTNCRECGENSCLAFATKVISENVVLELCPYVSKDIIRQYQKKIDTQHKKGVFAKKDVAKEALEWAKNRASSMKLEDIATRLGGELTKYQDKKAVKLPYFKDYVYITKDGIFSSKGRLDHWEQVFLYNHIAQGGQRDPTSHFLPFHELPNTVSKIKSLEKHILKPIIDAFSGKLSTLKKKAVGLGAIDISKEYPSSDLALKFIPLPKIPIILLYWDEEKDEHIPAQVNFLFNETIIEHLDIESILFLLEKLVSLLIKN